MFNELLTMRQESLAGYVVVARYMSTFLNLGL